MNSKLASLAVGRRVVALALFSGQELECFDFRSLPNDKEKAEAGAAAFIRKAFETLQFGTAAIQSGKLGSARREDLRQVIYDTLREQGVPILETSEEELFAGFRSPPISRRGEFRKIVCSMFPQLSEHEANLPLVDAVALGLHMATERVLAVNDQNE